MKINVSGILQTIDGRSVFVFHIDPHKKGTELTGLFEPSVETARPPYSPAVGTH